MMTDESKQTDVPLICILIMNFISHPSWAHIKRQDKTGDYDEVAIKIHKWLSKIKIHTY